MTRAAQLNDNAEPLDDGFWATAHHEAGHIVVLFLRRRHIGPVAFDVNGGSVKPRLLPQPRVGPGGIVRDRRQRCQIEDHIVASFAGEAAERRFRGANHAKWSADRERIAWLSALLFESRYDRQRVRFLLYLREVARDQVGN